MKKLKLENPSYRELLIYFKEWLDIIGYVEHTVYGFPILLQEFLYWLEQHNINRVELITKEHVTAYYQYLKERPKENGGGALGKSHLNKHQQALKKFKEYLQKYNSINLTLGLRAEKIERIEKLNILTIDEAKQLFETANDQPYQRKKYRDLTILVLLYSCGLRRSEAAAVNKNDINFDTRQLHVKKAKNYKERIIPINRYNLEILETYIYEVRQVYNTSNKTEALILNQLGRRMLGRDYAKHLKELIASTENKDLIDKKITLHALRHSIATHLLHQGMNIEDIQQFLGHSYLDTTQIYTHLIHKL